MIREQDEKLQRAEQQLALLRQELSYTKESLAVAVNENAQLVRERDEHEKHHHHDHEAHGAASHGQGAAETERELQTTRVALAEAQAELASIKGDQDDLFKCLAETDIKCRGYKQRCRVE